MLLASQGTWQKQAHEAGTDEAWAQGPEDAAIALAVLDTPRFLLTGAGLWARLEHSLTWFPLWLRVA